MYFFAAVAIIYCQDSVYRLNAIISIVFAVITLHQICGKVDTPPEESPEELELRRKIQRIREGLFAETMQDGTETMPDGTETLNSES